MGWARGSELCEELWQEIKQYVPTCFQEELSAIIVSKFVECDADAFEYGPNSIYRNYLKRFCPEDYEELMKDDE